MSETSPNGAPRAPNGVAWFAPWRWKPWTRWAIVGVLLIGYAVSPGSVLRGLDRSGIGQRYPVLITVFQTFYTPLQFAYDRSSVVASFYNWQNAAWDKLLNKPQENSIPRAESTTKIRLPEGMPPLISVSVEAQTNSTTSRLNSNALPAMISAPIATETKGR